MAQIPFLSVEWERLPEHTEPDTTVREIDGVLMRRKIVVQLDKIPQYPLLRSPVHETFSQEIARRLLFIIKDPEHPLPHEKRIHKEAIHQLQSINTACNSRTGQLRVVFSDRHGLGRWYANNDLEDLPRTDSAVGSILRLPRLLKSTLLAERGYTDIDQVKSHPTLMCAIAHLCGVECPGLEDYVLRYDQTVASMAAHWTMDPANPVTNEDVKALVNRTVYGGGLNQWITDVQSGVSTLDFQGLPAFSTKPKPVRYANSPQFIPLAFRRIRDECRAVSEIIYRSNPDIKARVCKENELADDNKCQRRVVSYVFQTVEHFITYTALQHCVEKHYIPVNHKGEHCFIWGYDGFSWILPTGHNVATVVQELNDRVYSVCGDAFSMVRFISKDIGEVIPEVLDNDDALWATEQYAAFSGKFDTVVEDILKIYRSIAVKDYRNFKLYFERDHFKVLRKASHQYARETRNDRGHLERVDWFSQATMKECYSNLVYTGREEVRGKEKDVIKVGVATWYNDPSMRMYMDAQVYPPPLVCPPSHFNLWTESPFHDLPLRPGQQEDRRGIDAFKYVLFNICGKDQVSMDYCENWISHMIQKPGEKIGTALAFGGSEGVGKTLCCYYVERMVGRGRYIDTKLDNIVGSFNHLLENRILVVINELGKRLTSEQSDALKALITDSELSIQQKGVDQRETLSYHRVIVTSNNPGSIDSSRRPFYVKATCEIKLAGQATKDALWALTKDDSAIAGLYRYYQNRPIPQDMTPPNNEINREFRASRDPYASFALYLCNTAFPNQVSAEMSSSELHMHYTAWCAAEMMGPEWEQRSAATVGKDFAHKYSWTPEAVSPAFHTHGGRIQKRTYNFERIRVEVNHVF